MDLDDVRETARAGNAARLHDETARLHGDATAIEYHGTTLTHDELREESARFAGGLAALGVDPGDVLLQYLPNCPAYLIGALGAFKAGVAVSPVNPQYRRRELTYQLEDTDASAVLTHAALLPYLQEALEGIDWDPVVIGVGSTEEGVHMFSDVREEELFVERSDDDLALLPYTSGTTGKPKGVRLTHRNFRAQMFSVLSQTGELEDEDVRSLVWLPLYHITGFTHTAWQPLLRGGSVFLRSAANWDGDAAMELIEEEGITHYVGVTAMYVDMVNSENFGEYDLTSLESAGEGGAKMSVAIQEEFEAVAGVEMGEGYGLTETHGATHSQASSTFGLRHGTIGQPTRQTDCKIVDSAGEEVPPGEEGELIVRGPQVMDSYHNLPDATDAAFTENGYFRTGDIARRDAKNYYEIVDRKKHMINSAGYNIYPSELEELLSEHEAIAEGAVVGIPDERRNEVPKAFVVLAPDVEAGVDVTEEAIKDYFLERVAAYKHPRAVEFIDELPRTTSGKIQKYKLEE
ncbi:class I adenylate-forming enzyme family protein [Natronorubrum daqingense]|uniref:AMP-dependent synthetase n=1 Tax=Natronorubrum daqingense TaxID=588898 RepID=A0A1N7E8A0_9EURY|nr:AMP-binding protein [Natronorubrum daqingense]APX96415.1 AMP-dependent synthetase [Natronorubrum daqingense]SIR84290.1 long-chain acyl-CoA synthetase [Natronorubrum daqingense]